MKYLFSMLQKFKNIEKYFYGLKFALKKLVGVIFLYLTKMFYLSVNFD